VFQISVEVLSSSLVRFAFCFPSLSSRFLFHLVSRPCPLFFFSGAVSVFWFGVSDRIFLSHLGVARFLDGGLIWWWKAAALPLVFVSQG
jgi:hypothetical protein